MRGSKNFTLFNFNRDGRIPRILWAGEWNTCTDTNRSVFKSGDSFILWFHREKREFSVSRYQKLRASSALPCSAYLVWRIWLSGVQSQESPAWKRRNQNPDFTLRSRCRNLKFPNGFECLHKWQKVGTSPSRKKSFEKKRKIKLDEDGIPYVSSP